MLEGVEGPISHIRFVHILAHTRYVAPVQSHHVTILFKAKYQMCHMGKTPVVHKGGTYVHHIQAAGYLRMT